MLYLDNCLVKTKDSQTTNLFGCSYCTELDQPWRPPPMWPIRCDIAPAAQATRHRASVRRMPSMPNVRRCRWPTARRSFPRRRVTAATSSSTTITTTSSLTTINTITITTSSMSITQVSVLIPSCGSWAPRRQFCHRTLVPISRSAGASSGRMPSVLWCCTRWPPMACC